jgi:hypothetical protein
MLHKPIRFKESPETRGNTPCRARDPRLCGNRSICGSMTLILPPLRIFKVLLARGSSTNMEPPAEYWRSRFHASKADKISDSPETRENARAPVRDPRFCAYRQGSASFAATCVSGRCCPRPLYSKVRFCLGRTWNGRRDTKKLFKKTSYVESFFKTDAEITLKQKPVLDFIFLPITSVILLDADPISTFTTSLTL